jgi:hypothetical protein
MRMLIAEWRAPEVAVFMRAAVAPAVAIKSIQPKQVPWASILIRPFAMPDGRKKLNHRLRTSRPLATSKCDNFERNDIPSSPT